MSVSLGGATEVRFVYCAHQHEEGEACNRECIHDERCQKEGNTSDAG